LIKTLFDRRLGPQLGFSGSYIRTQNDHYLAVARQYASHARKEFWGTAAFSGMWILILGPLPIFLGYMSVHLAVRQDYQSEKYNDLLRFRILMSSVFFSFFTLMFLMTCCWVVPPSELLPDLLKDFREYKRSTALKEELEELLSRRVESYKVVVDGESVDWHASETFKSMLVDVLRSCYMLRFSLQKSEEKSFVNAEINRMRQALSLEDDTVGMKTFETLRQKAHQQALLSFERRDICFSSAFEEDMGEVVEESKGTPSDAMEGAAAPLSETKDLHHEV
jgi:hypothetical protein